MEINNNAIDQLESALRGEVEIHRWSGIVGGKECPWMTIVVIEPGTEVSDTPPDMPQDFIEATGIKHEGVASRKMLEERLAQLRRPDIDNQ